MVKKVFITSFFISGALLCCTASVAVAQTIFVDAGAVGNNNGSSWTNAYNHLQDALVAASSSDEIWVAEGIYKPDRSLANPSGSGQRTATFQLLNGVALYGGYAGSGEPDPNARDVEEYETILTGDLNGDDDSNFVNYDENSYHVVTGSNTDANAVLDGFTITRGNGNNGTLFPNDTGGGMLNLSGSPTVNNCTFSKNYALTMGGGMYNRESSSPTITNCTFIENKSDDDGGGMRNYINCDPIITDCSFIGNIAFEEGGGMGNRKNSNPIITNCRFVGNVAVGGGGMDNQIGKATPTGVPIIINCIFTGNSAPEGGGIRNNDPNLSATNCTFSGNIGSGMNNRDCTPTVTNCILWGNTGGSFDGYGTPIVTFSNVEGGFAGQGNINIDPLFADVSNGDYHLKAQSGRWDPNSQSWIQDDMTSPCIDAGDPNSSIGYEPYPNGGIINMGAYGGTEQASKSYSTGVVPAITSTTVTAATVNQAYSYDVDATGIPAPTYALTVSPAGMTINATTGVISWTPIEAQLGLNAVT
ncbi:MAG: putative Ig domain-containing protein, partial [Planctomycetota bacterium]